MGWTLALAGGVAEIRDVVWGCTSRGCTLLRGTLIRYNPLPRVTSKAVPMNPFDRGRIRQMTPSTSKPLQLQRVVHRKRSGMGIQPYSWRILSHNDTALIPPITADGQHNLPP